MLNLTEQHVLTRWKHSGLCGGRGRQCFVPLKDSVSAQLRENVKSLTKKVHLLTTSKRPQPPTCLPTSTKSFTSARLWHTMSEKAVLLEAESGGRRARTNQSWARAAFHSHPRVMFGWSVQKPNLVTNTNNISCIL